MPSLVLKLYQQNLIQLILDHLPVITVWNEKKEKLYKKAELVQKINYKKLTENFRNFNMGEIKHLNYNDAFNSMHGKIIDEVEKCKFYLPKKNIPRNEWINQECIKLGREVHRLKKKFNRINSAKNESLYKNAKKEYQKMIRREKNDYYKKKLENCKGDSHKIWQVINELLRRKSKKSSAKNDILIENGMSYSSDEEICEFLNNYYRNIAI